MYCIETRELSHRFTNGELALDNIGLKVEEGAVYGFLGPNGAGKTTTLRLLLGLLKPQQGDIMIFGKPLATQRIPILQDLGSLIESPALYMHLNAGENLQVWQKLYRCPPQRIPQVLQMVGLQHTGTKAVAQFSLGMKQRLSIAVALLNEPKLLILDEPTNGLDPNGIIEIRELLKKLNREAGMTILISSHLLPEIEKMVTNVGIISSGELLYQGRVNDLYRPGTVFRTGDPERTAKLFGKEIADGEVILPSVLPQDIARATAMLVDHGIAVHGIRPAGGSLEEIFMKLITRS